MGYFSKNSWLAFYEIVTPAWDSVVCLFLLISLKFQFRTLYTRFWHFVGKSNIGLVYKDFAKHLEVTVFSSSHGFWVRDFFHVEVSTHINFLGCCLAIVTFISFQTIEKRSYFTSIVRFFRNVITVTVCSLGASPSKLNFTTYIQTPFHFNGITNKKDTFSRLANFCCYFRKSFDEDVSDVTISKLFWALLI